MAPVSSAAVRIIVFSCICSFALGQSVSTERVFISPRFAPDLSTALPRVTPASLRVDSWLVQIPVHVTTAYGASVTSLSKTDFKLFEDDTEQTISHFSQDDAPVSVGILFDASGSMQNKIKKSSEAAVEFFKTANPEDEFFLVEFNERAKLTLPFTSDADAVAKKITRIRPFGRTALLDAIHLASVEMKNAHHVRKAIVIVSDGGDNRSRYTAHEIKNTLLESDVQVYAIGIFDPDDAPKRTPEEINGPRLLDDLAEQTGGRLYPVERLDDLTSICERIGNELRSQYLLGYSPNDATRDGKYRHVKVKLVDRPEMPNLRTYYRHGYYAPAQ